MTIETGDQRRGVDFETRLVVALLREKKPVEDCFGSASLNLAADRTVQLASSFDVADSDVVAQDLLNRATELARSRRCGYVELRHMDRRFPHLPFKDHKVTMRLRLDSHIWSRLDRKVRNQIRKAQKSDLTSEHHESAGPSLRECIESMTLEFVDPIEGASKLAPSNPQALPADAPPLMTRYASKIPAAVADWWLDRRVARRGAGRA